jgi:predicted DNA-binding transcriptional regulator AlpA
LLQNHFARFPSAPGISSNASMKTTSTPIILDRLAASASDVAKILGISRAQVWKLHSAGKLPLPVRLGCKKPVWVIEELQAWLAAGAPDRASWLKLREGRR